MALSLLNFFKRNPGKAQVATPAPAKPPVAKPSSQRFSKTVMPSVTRAVSSSDPFQLSDNPGAAQSGLPPAIAVALAPKVERVIAFALADVVSQMPAGYLRQLQAGDADRHILLKAAELEKG